MVETDQSQEEITARLFKPVNPNDLPKHKYLIVSNAIAAAGEYKRLLSLERVREANEALTIAYTLTDYIYKNTDPRKNIIFPQFRFDEEITENGVLGLIIEPDKEYPTGGQAYFLLKKVDDLRGRQVYRDSQHFQSNREFNLEYILANLPIPNEDNSYLWKEWIRGPNLADLFQVLDNGILKGTEEEKKLLRKSESELVDIAIKRVLYWQKNAPDLIDIPKDPEKVIENYQINFMNVFHAFSKLTEVHYSTEERDSIRSALENLDWRFINKDTIVRKLDATYRNMVILTHKINIDYPKFIELFTENGDKRKVNRWALEEKLYFVDTPNKYSHILEDLWEMDLFSVGKVKKNAVDYAVESYKEGGLKFNEFERLIMGIYRVYRKAHLVLDDFGPRALERFNAGLIEQEEYKRKQSKYRNHINYLLGEGQNLLDQIFECLPINQKKQFKVIGSALQKLSNYTTIVYTPYLL